MLTLRLLTLLLIAVMLVFDVVSGPRPAFSQGAELVMVDVPVVAGGYRVSKRNGHNVVDDKNKSARSMTSSSAMMKGTRCSRSCRSAAFSASGAIWSRFAMTA